MAVGNAFTALGSALFAACGSATSLSVYQGLAPQGGSVPYAVFNMQTNQDQYTFNTRGLSATYQVKVVSNQYWASSAQTAYDAMHQKLQDAALNVTGYYVQRMRRESMIMYQDPDNFWHVGGIYRIDLQEN